MPRLEVENKTPQQDLLIFSGYENLISKIDHWTEWMGTIDFTALKTKLLARSLLEKLVASVRSAT